MGYRLPGAPTLQLALVRVHSEVVRCQSIKSIDCITSSSIFSPSRIVLACEPETETEESGLGVRSYTQRADGLRTRTLAKTYSFRLFFPDLSIVSPSRVRLRKGAVDSTGKSDEFHSSASSSSSEMRVTDVSLAPFIFSLLPFPLFNLLFLSCSVSTWHTSTPTPASSIEWIHN